MQVRYEPRATWQSTAKVKELDQFFPEGVLTVNRKFSNGCHKYASGTCGDGKIGDIITPDYPGCYVVPNHPMCIDNSQREWSTKSLPAVVTQRAAIHPDVILAEPHQGKIDYYATPQGPIGVAVTKQLAAYMPSTATLEAAPNNDTRYTAISDRYYR